MPHLKDLAKKSRNTLTAVAAVSATLLLSGGA